MADAPTTITDFIKAVLPGVEKYREAQINKYHREEETEYGGEYSRLERYKNRVRIVDIFLPTMQKMAAVDTKSEPDLPKID